MAQTKRKRRNKHRGNAVGIVEARGRTSKPREGDTRARSGRGTAGGRAGARPLKPPTLQGSLLKASMGGIVLFALTYFGVLGKSATVGGALGLAALAVIFYTPIMYMTDRWVYKRKSAQAAAGGKR